ncbi:MAG: hypothetical protein H0X36_03105, partial [Sphingomonadaceae bacterium]|nr:hypothetical protein [Sphingomonadaceae bacterium]
MRAHPFPWRPLLFVWAAISVLLVVMMYTAILTGSYADPDDLMRLQQVRDLAGGQGWFDMTQHRMAPPAGLSMHWSRLVDIPLLIFMAPLTPLLGQPAAEAIAVTAAPLLTLLVLLVGLVFAMRRLFGPLPSIPLFAPLLLVSAPAVMAQIHPTRIDHHGWQIAFAALAFAGLLARDPRRSGLAAGTATAIYLSISLEGLPFALACAAILALLWALGRESGVRLTAFMAALAGAGAALFVLTAPTLRWSEPYCDALMPAHVVTLAVAALGTAGAVRFAG